MVEDGTGARETGQDFIRYIIRADIGAGRNGTVISRFPRKPNGCLHARDTSSVCLNFGGTSEFAGQCHLHVNDNRAKEEQGSIYGIQGVRRLRFGGANRPVTPRTISSNSSPWAIELIRTGMAYVDDQSPGEMS
ncbi:glutamate--tRNA ligase family protein [Bauldia litoralis]|uniref:tRNA synthetases class I (E and Q), catalytic domain n=1 Tax=Bauldia litoralis TaxID=665467 RepID=A0A1G6CVI6_9HYPH|nr:glutamate--tRNA ligase family protein [Bauldia litoralis]SDB36899.1 tRNA synthetases class I (E and Q), catalytic domain [Bauldia litoralis]